MAYQAYTLADRFSIIIAAGAIVAATIGFGSLSTNARIEDMSQRIDDVSQRIDGVSQRIADMSDVILVANARNEFRVNFELQRLTAQIETEVQTLRTAILQTMLCLIALEQIEEDEGPTPSICTQATIIAGPPQ